MEIAAVENVPPFRLRLYQFQPLTPDEVASLPLTEVTRLTVEPPEEVELVTHESGDLFAYDCRDGSYTEAQHVALRVMAGTKGYRVVSEEPV